MRRGRRFIHMVRSALGSVIGGKVGGGTLHTKVGCRRFHFHRTSFKGCPHKLVCKLRLFSD